MLPTQPLTDRFPSARFAISVQLLASHTFVYHSFCLRWCFGRQGNRLGNTWWRHALWRPDINVFKIRTLCVCDTPSHPRART